jgi:hypothetical protein
MSKEPKKENPLDRLKDVLKTPTMPVHELPAKKDKKSPWQPVRYRVLCTPTNERYRMKDLPTRGYVTPMSDEQKARLMAIINKDSNVVFVDFTRKW